MQMDGEKNQKGDIMSSNKEIFLEWKCTSNPQIFYR